MKLKVNLVVTILVSLLFATDTYACSVYRTRPFSGAEMVAETDAIIVATAEIYVTGAASRNPDSSGMVPDSRVRFSVTEVIRGKFREEYLVLPGTLVEKDDFNDHPSPYTFVRPEGRHGNCFATSYRSGGKFLLMLRKDPGGMDSTVYWYPLAPVNEQLHSADDPWLLWVRKQSKELEEKSAKHPGRRP